MTVTRVAWFRRDLRLHDNPAWAAASAGDRVVALVVIERELLDRAGPHRRRAFLTSLATLDAALRDHGGRLRVATGDPAEKVARVVDEVGADEVHVNADVSRWSCARDTRVREALDGAGAVLVDHWGTLVHPPGTVLTQKGTLSRVFTPFHKAWVQVPLPDEARPGDAVVADDPGEGLPPDHPDPESPAAPLGRLGAWVRQVDDYPQTRDLPAISGTSHLSIDLRFGRLSPRHVAEVAGGSPGGDAFVRQLAWRDWYAHLTAEHPDIDRVALRPEYDRIVWETGPDADAAFAAWRDGRTGYPIVDAGMRQLAATGWMHNRVRMITASFLVKDLLVDWRRGERWFRHLLADADIPQNAGNWQWVAGTGPDAAPYFRVFNPTLQSRKFDPDGTYIRTWVPELAALDADTVHAPAEAPPLDLAAAGITLGDTYPWPIVDHHEAKEDTIAAYKAALQD